MTSVHSAKADLPSEQRYVGRRVAAQLDFSTAHELAGLLERLGRAPLKTLIAELRIGAHPKGDVR